MLAPSVRGPALYRCLRGVSSQADQTDKSPEDALRRVRMDGHDLIGPPHPESKIRQVRFCVPRDETPLQTRLRELREETLNWNHDFWTKHNQEFAAERKQFARDFKQQHYGNDSTKQTLTANEMSHFYKDYLDKHRHRHLSYSIEWQNRNFRILFLSILVGLEQIFKKK